MSEKMQYWFAVLFLLVAMGCKNHETATTDNGTPDIAPAYLPINETGCRDSVGINGKWRLLFARTEGRTTAATSNNILIVKDCSILEYYSDDRFIKRDSFKLFRVLNYCADYQLNYISKNDSISCINMKKDTLIFGDCSTFETTRYFYKKM